MKPGRPSALIAIDGRKLNAAEAALVHLSLVLSNGSHNSAELVFWPRTKFASAAVGSKISVAAGTNGAEKDVLAGEITAVSRTPLGVAIEALAATVQLSRSRRSQTYINQSVADIVRDLARPVDIDEVEADLQLEAYSVDTERTVWGHLLDLARLSGADVGSSPAGGLRFVPVRPGSASRTFRFGADILDWDVAKAKGFEVPGVAPHGAASEAGKDKWHWLVRDPVGAGGKPSRVVGAFHTRDAADQLASALKDRAKRSDLRGEVRLVGEPRVRPGEVVKIRDLPGPDPGPLRVLEVHHELDGSGFLTSLVVEGAGGGPGLPI